MLQQVSDAGGDAGGAPGGQDHVKGPATQGITAVDPPQPGLQQVLDGSQLAVKAGHVERWQTLEDKVYSHHCLPFSVFYN